MTSTTILSVTVAIAAILVATVACTPRGLSAIEAHNATENSFAKPKRIGTLPDGRAVFTVNRFVTGKTEPDRLYYIGATLTHVDPANPTVVAVHSLGEITTDQKVAKARLLVTEAQRLVAEAEGPTLQSSQLIKPGEARADTNSAK